jgi:hypothetical protein
VTTNAVNQHDQLFAHLHSQGALAGPLRLADPVALFDDVPGLVLAADGVLTFDGREVRTTRRHLTDLLTAGGSQPLHLADRAAAQAAIEDGQNPLLYRAVRDVFPSRAITDGRVRADLVVYEPGTLPGGEPYRSLGHWNLPTQLEVFQFLTGRMAMVVAGETASGQRFVYFQVCQSGDTVAVPLSVWHVSYVLDGPAAVFNISADLHTPVNTSGYDKYRRGAPVGVTLCRQGESVQPISTPDTLQAWGEPEGPPRADWLAEWLPEGQSLASMHLSAPARQWGKLVTAFLNAHERDWPVCSDFPFDTRK